MTIKMQSLPLSPSPRWGETPPSPKISPLDVQRSTFDVRCSPIQTGPTSNTSGWIEPDRNRNVKRATKHLPLPGGEGRGEGERKCSSTKFKPVVSPRQSSPRLAREWRTVETMVRLYCRDHHQTSARRSRPGTAGVPSATSSNLCVECQALLDYASLRLDRCRFGTEKPTCAKCPVHCYQKDRREQVRAVMRYAGPRMLWEHPLLSLRHWLDGLTAKTYEKMP